MAQITLPPWLRHCASMVCSWLRLCGDAPIAAAPYPMEGITQCSTVLQHPVGGVVRDRTSCYPSLAYDHALAHCMDMCGVPCIVVYS